MPPGWAGLGLRLAGGGLLIASGAIHLDLYLTGYRSIPTIAGLFLLQVIAAFLLGAAVLLSASRLAAAAGAIFALATLGGYLLSLWIGLFGFTEVRTTAGIAAGVIEAVAFAVLAALAARPAERGRAAAAAIAGVSVVALAMLGGSVAAADGPATTTAGGTLKTVRIGAVTVLADAAGRSLYWFAPDTATRSACYGSCAAYWPPVKGPVTAGPGVTGQLSTLTRSDGSIQAAYDGHPLYTYVGDSAPGQANGNGLNLNGGLWHEVTPSAPRSRRPLTLKEDHDGLGYAAEASAPEPDRTAARPVARYPGQGWSLLCNAVVLFDDDGKLLLDVNVAHPASTWTAAAA